MKTYFCVICKCDVAIKDWRHTRLKHNLTNKEYYDQFVKKTNEDVCPTCGQINPWISILKGYQQHCSIKCAMNDANTKLKRTQLYKEKTGYDNPLANPEVHVKAKETYKTKTGVDHPSKNPDVIKSRTEHYYEKTGYLHPMQNPEIKQKFETTYKERTGYTSPFLNPDIVEKVKRINFEKTGYEYNFENPEFQKQINEQRFLRTGVHNSMQLLDVQMKAKRKYFYDDKFFDSSWEIAYYIWLTDNNVNFVYHPKIKFAYKTPNDEKIHYYFPDFKVNDEYVEIKGDHLLSSPSCKISIEKEKCIREHAKILTSDDVKPFLDYVEEKYGKNYYKKFRYNKKHK